MVHWFLFTKYSFCDIIGLEIIINCIVYFQEVVSRLRSVPGIVLQAFCNKITSYGAQTIIKSIMYDTCCILNRFIVLISTKQEIPVNLGNSESTESIRQAKGEPGQAPLPTPTLETNMSEISLMPQLEPPHSYFYFYLSFVMIHP